MSDHCWNLTGFNPFTKIIITFQIIKKLIVLAQFDQIRIQNMFKWQVHSKIPVEKSNMAPSWRQNA